MSRKNPSHPWIIAIIVCCVLGLIVTGVLTATHYRIAEEGLMQKSFCTFSSKVDCDIPLTSAYSHVWRIPNSELGFLFYVVIGSLALWGLLNTRRRESIFSFIVLASGAALIYAIYMAYLLLIKLAIICIFCMASHLLTCLIFLFALIVRALPPWNLPQFGLHYIVNSFRRQSNPETRTAFFQYLGISMAIYLVGILFFFGLNEQAHSKEPTFNKSSLLVHFYRQEPVAIATAGRPTWGRVDAPVTIVDFSDFQCPFCRRAAFSLKPYVGEFRKDVKIVYLNYPLDSTCNPHLDQARHPAACLAAQAALCAYKQGNASFWKLHDLIFKNQDHLTQHLIIEELAPKVGIPATQMRQCIESGQSDSMIAEDIEMGQKAELQGTPAIYINGRYLNGWAQPSVLRTIIAAEIARARGNPPPEYLRATQ